MTQISQSPAVHIGVAGWSIPASLTECFDAADSHLERYASRFSAVEINSSFHRPHRRSTYARWAAAAPEIFRFAVKLPKAITHERRLLACSGLISSFAEAIDGLGSKRGPVLVQLPPSLAFEGPLIEDFFAELMAILSGTFVCEPRHASWFSSDAETLLERLGVSRVAADPPRLALGSGPGGSMALAYFRLHGSPRVYWSPYSDEKIAAQALTIKALRARGSAIWTIFDNTAGGAAPANALSLMQRLTSNPTLAR